MRLPQAQLGPEHHPEPPTPVSLSGTSQVWALRQCSGPHAEARRARRGRCGPTRGPCQAGRMGLLRLLPSRKAMGLPQRFREQPFPAGTSPRKPIPGREPRAGSALPAASSVSTGRVHLHVGEPPCKGETLTALLPQGRGVKQGFPLPHSIRETCHGRKPSIPPFSHL